MIPCTLDHVRAALALPGFDGEAAQLLMAPALRPRQRPAALGTTPRLGGVLLLLYCVDDELHLVLTLRPTYEGIHSGQVSCPGGRHEPPESLAMTALRETEEEIGVPPSVDRYALITAFMSAALSASRPTARSGTGSAPSRSSSVVVAPYSSWPRM